ncbi:MAG: serine/threonine protein kinase [Cyanobacteria bacterium REEB65]|nr:serine/threonine protein kinase [Cyanobacteria bacterium REEB65]
MGSMPKTSEAVRCPGCGLKLVSSGQPNDRQFRSSAECRMLYDELSAYTLSLADPAFPHQFVVDAYAAQHVAEDTRPIRTTFALVGLYLACEHGFTGRQVQRAHMLLADRKCEWPRFESTGARGGLTVLDPLKAQPGAMRDGAIRAWGASVWRSWSHSRNAVIALVQERLDSR